MHGYLWNNFLALELLGPKIRTLLTLFDDIARVLHVRDRAGAALQKMSHSSCLQLAQNAGSFLLPENVVAP